MASKLARLLLLLVALAPLQSCFSTAGIARLEVPIERKITAPPSFSVLPQGICTASIGDVLFELRRYKTGAVERPTKTTPPKNFPIDAVWAGTHSFTEKDGTKYTVFTTPKYISGNVGVILDAEDRLATPRPIIYVGGLLKGIRKGLSADGKFFYVPAELIESWGLRYGGRRGTDFVFEIIDRANPTTVQILQTVQIAEDAFFKEFVVRGVTVRGIAAEENGVIRYTLEDRRVAAHAGRD